MTRNSPAGDAIKLEILRNALESVVDECFVGLMKSSYSSNIKERRDHSVALFDAAGNLIAQAKQSLPIHLGSMTGLIEVVIARSERTPVRPGDIFVANDPYVAGGTHLPDLNFATPIFAAERLIGFLCNIAHHSDFGGMLPGSMGGGMSEIYQEGLRVPLVRLFRAGEIDDDVLQLILLNTRVTDERRGDLLAQVAACTLGQRRMQELIAVHGADTLLDSFRELLLRTEARLRRAISEVPDGTYRFEDVMDDDGIDARNIRICVTATVRGDSLHLDFEGTAGQVAGNINCTASATRSAIGYAVKALLDPDVPNNQGVFNAVTWTARPGTIVNAAFPAAVANRAHTVQRIIDVIIGAFSRALPLSAVAAANGANTTAVFTGLRPENGERYVYIETLGGGFGGRATKDGKDGVQVHITNTSNMPVEAIEMEYPLFVESYGFVEDSGGAGQYRGGLALERVVRSVGHTCTFSGSGERFDNAPWGLFGGKAGVPGRFALRGADGRVERVSNKPASVPFGPEQAVLIRTPGAGGYGPPEQRSPASLETDRRQGKFSPTFLRTHYPSHSPEAADSQRNVSGMAAHQT
jgi:N-methylhydantoinase B